MRDLNKEYKDMVLNETPDIWSKIEAGLDERQKTAGVQAAVKKGPRHRIVNFKRMPIYITAAAAAVICICVVIPVLRGSNDMAATESIKADHVREAAPAAAAAADSAMAEEDSYDYEKKAAGDTRGENSYSSKLTNDSALSIENIMGMEETAPREDACAEAEAEEDVAEAQAAGVYLIRIVLAEGADKEVLNTLIDEFSLTLCEENEDGLIFAIPEGADIEELAELASKDANIADSEIMLSEEGLNIIQ